MDSEHSKVCPDGTVDDGVTGEKERSPGYHEPQKIRAILRRNDRAKQRIAVRLLEQGMVKESVEKILHISVSE